MRSLDNFKNFSSREAFFLDFLTYLIPLSILIGNFAININLIIISIVLIINLIVNKVKFFLTNKEKSLILLFLIILILNIIFSEHRSVSLIEFFGLIKHVLFFISLYFCFKFINNFEKNFFFVLIITLSFVSLDTLIQFVFSKDIFGFEPYIILNDQGSIILRRLSGPFGDEYVAGAFLAKLTFLALIFFDIKKKNKFNELIILFFSIVVLLSNERSATIMILFGMFIYIFLNPEKNFLKKILKTILISAIILVSFTQNKHLTNHYQNFVLKKNDEAISIIKNFKDTQWGAHHLTALEISKDNFLLGSGIGTFRYVCANSEYEKINSKLYEVRCSTHPHNIYLEILSEAGIIFFLLFIYCNFKVFFYLIKKIIFTREIQYNLLFCSYVILFNPLQTTGSFFSTWNGIFYWVFISYIVYRMNIFKIKKMINFSIITVVKNDVKNIEKTIKNVLSQKYQNFEYIIVDGNSQDGTSEIIKKYKNKIIHLRAKDKNIYDALNKGIKKAKGDFIGIIHSGDVYRKKNILNMVGKELRLYDLVSYNMNYVSKDNKIIRKWKLEINKLTKYNFFYIAHPTLFLNKKIFKKKIYDISYKIAGDTDFLCHLSKQIGLNYKYYNKTIMNCLYGGISTKRSFFLKKFNEDLNIFYKHFGFIGIFLLFAKIFIKIRSLSF